MGILRRALSAVRPDISEVNNRLDRLSQITGEALRRQIVETDARLADPRALNHFEAQLFSQSGQDGILAELFRRLGVNVGTFVEFGVGVGGGFETNTTALLLQGWRGLWIEASEAAVAEIATSFREVIDGGRLRVKRSLVTPNNIAGLLRDGGIEPGFDLLSIDIDGNDLHVWQALREHQPKAVVIEYNSFFPATIDWCMPYDPPHGWDGTIEFGASSLALERAGAEFGYKLVACDITGSDCFFVRNDLCGDRFIGPHSAAQWHHPMRYYLITRSGYTRRLPMRSFPKSSLRHSSCAPSTYADSRRTESLGAIK
jgi:hypothetical protein